MTWNPRHRASPQQSTAPGSRREAAPPRAPAGRAAPTAGAGGAAADSAAHPALSGLAFDDLLRQLMGRGQDILASQERLRGLLRANQALLADLDLHAVLQRLTTSAREVVGARYAALGVLDGHGGLAEFIHDGMDPATVEAIGRLPHGKGVLGALTEDPRPLRVDDLAEHLASAGFPSEHPPMTGFLGVPIRIGEEVFGNLYFTDSERGRFGPEDEEVAVALAATAALVIDHARHLETSRRRGDWLAATADVTSSMLSGTTDRRPLELIAERAYQLADADLVAVLLPSDESRDHLRVAAAVGGPAAREAASGLIGVRSGPDDTLCSRVFTTGTPVRLDDAQDRLGLPPTVLSTTMDVGPVLVAPLTGTHETRGVLTVARATERTPFREEDLEMAAAFANHASVALELAEGRVERDRAVLTDERERIAADLHDHIIQRLFAAGLALTGLTTALGDHPSAARVADVVHDLDDAIAHIRTTIFTLRQSSHPDAQGFRSRVLDVVQEAGEVLGHTPALRLTGPLDTAWAGSRDPQTLGDDLLAVLREALSNIARHAQATHVDIDLVVETDERGRALRLVAEISDDGVGIGRAPVRSSGLDNLRRRAERHGGSSSLQPRRPRGATLTWTARLD